MNTYTLEEGRQKAAGAVCAAFRRKGRRKEKVKRDKVFFITDPSEHDITQNLKLYTICRGERPKACAYSAGAPTRYSDSA
ncbi:MAG: hypothetical protein F6K17_13480 [Okeania sp. SIO3C4]|nr:hypothetical protein [Okeania sp. SIO3C4]